MGFSLEAATRAINYSFLNNFQGFINGRIRQNKVICRDALLQRVAWHLAADQLSSDSFFSLTSQDVSTIARESESPFYMLMRSKMVCSQLISL